MASNAVFSALTLEGQQRLLNKLSKLKALSECKTGNVNETATAAATMTRLMTEYQIEMADLQLGGSSEEQKVLTEDVTGQISRRGFPAWHVCLLTSFAAANNCVSYTNSERRFHGWSVEKVSTLRLIGTREDIQNTRDLFVFCIQEIEQLCHSWAPRASVARKNDFRYGAAVGISEKVEQERAAVLAEEKARSQVRGQTSQALALFDRKQEAVDAKARDIGLIFDRRSSSRAMSANAYEAGYRAGASLNLSAKPQLALR